VTRKYPERIGALNSASGSLNARGMGCLRRAFPFALLVLPFAACSATSNGSGGGSSTSSTSTSTSTSTSSGGQTTDGGTTDGHLCNLPGSIRFTANGKETIPGNDSPVDLSFVKVPEGFCVHHYAHVGNARQLRFAPGGELFVASPTELTTGGGPGGQSAIMIVPDDDQDGQGDKSVVFLGNIPATQGMLFTKTHFYYQNGTRILRLPYKAGDRAPSAAGEQVANITLYHSSLHWPKTLDISDSGVIYVGNGGDQNEICDLTRPFHGGILKLDGAPGGTPVARGLRNPIGVRCSRGHDRCYAVELAKDYSAKEGGREKLIPIRDGDDWGFPCCATKDRPYDNVSPVPNCSKTVAEANAFIIGSTPMDLAFEASGAWPAPWGKSVYVPLHGEAGTWIGARLVAIAVDPVTGEPMFGSDLDAGVSGGAMADFATGWDDRSLSHGRPAAVAFAPDGRLFIANDTNGEIFWIAPLSL
jgi:glucose/arabinose dehydrogenase